MKKITWEDARPLYLPSPFPFPLLPHNLSPKGSVCVCCCIHGIDIAHANTARSVRRNVRFWVYSH